MKEPALILALLVIYHADLYPQDENGMLFEKISHKSSSVKFINSLNETDSENMLTFINFYTGAGVGIIDVNNDRLQDIFLAGNQVTSRLYLNKGGFKFEDITHKAGVKTDRWITGVSIVDINQDGFDDIYLSVSGSWEMGNLLFVNNQNCTFTEMAAEYNLDVKEQTTHTSFFDYDRDGFLDAFLATNPVDFKLNSSDPLQKPKNRGESRGTDILLHNDGKGKFSDVSKAAGILFEGYSLGVNTSDFNHDGWTDIYVSNDYISNDILYINNGDGTFTNKLDDYFDYTSFASMGNDAGDFNNDGLIDLITLDMLPESSLRQKLIVGSRTYNAFMYTLGLGYFPQFSRNMLQLNNGNNTFSEIGRLANISKSDWCWAPLLVDLDYNGFKDLFITTGFRRDMGNLDFIYKTDNSPYRKGGEPVPIFAQLEAINSFEGVPVVNYVYSNEGNLIFKKVSADWGFDEAKFSSGAAVADLDNDGDMDLVVNNVDDLSSIYENKTNLSDNHYIKISLKGQKNNRSGIGAKVYIYYKGSQQYIDNNPYRGYMSTVDKNIFFGIGNCHTVDSLIVIWPDGTYTRLCNLSADKTIDVIYRSSLPPHKTKSKEIKGSINFKEISSNIGIEFKHKEDSYIDFCEHPLLPHQLSRLGPGIAVGDINSDGLEDFFVGGASGYPAKLFFQKSNYTFRSEDFPFDIECEDMGVLLFDYDGDNDLDLYVVSGGNSAFKKSNVFYDRLYENAGNGKFRKTNNVIPLVKSSGSVVTAADFDKDGDLDLFVGGRISPSNYPAPAISCLLENRNGKFFDITNARAPELMNIGMVSSALWTDFNNDNNLDLIIAGEWMPVSIFENEGDIFRNKTEKYGLSGTSGWWNCISSGIFNGNGSVKYILGNLGLNNPYTASDQSPLRIVSCDYDNNGRSEPLLIMKYPEGYYPLASRSQFLSAFPNKAMIFNTYQSYAVTSADDIVKVFGKNRIISFEAKMMANSIISFHKDGEVSINPLPVECQFSPVFGTFCNDMGGKSTEILFAGNFYPNNIDDGPYSASTGGLLSLNEAGCVTNVLRGHEIGFNNHSDARAIAGIVLGNMKRVFLVTNNNDSLRVFALEKSDVRHIKLDAMDAYAITELKNGQKQKHEFYYGSGYLSQSSRYLTLPADCKKVRVFTYSDQERIVSIF